MKKSKDDKSYFIEDDKPEFNQMAFYNIRMDKRSDERDMSLSGGNLVNFYRSTMSLLMNAVPRILQKKYPDKDIQEVYKKKQDIETQELETELLAIGTEIKSLPKLGNDQIQESNRLRIEEKLFQYNTNLNTVTFKYGLIFPLQTRKTIEDEYMEIFR